MKNKLQVYLIFFFFFSVTNSFSVASSLSIEGWILLPLIDSKEGQALKSIKASLIDVDNVLHGWDEEDNKDYCSWRGVQYLENTVSAVLLFLEGNRLSGQIPDEMGNCLGLQYLNLNGNYLSGILPPKIFKLTSLWDIGGNQITGKIPSSIGFYNILASLDNEVVGEIPYSIGFLQQLGFLKLQGNRLNGKIPEAIGLMQALGLLNLSSNDFEGQIPSEVGRIINLETLTLSLKMKNKLQVYLIFFFFFSVTNSFSVASSLSIEGWILLPLIDSKEGQALKSIKASLIDVDNVLHGWDEEDNKDYCSWRGVQYLENTVSAVLLFLEGNRLSGQIPDEMGNCLGLQYLNLNGNYLSGILPPKIFKLTSLWDIGGNQITGKIPSSIGFLQHFGFFDAVDNEVVGEIPYSIGFLQQLGFLKLQGNRLNGKIPEAIGLMQALGLLNLSSNDFEGQIPSEVGRIINLETLILTNNSFHGEVPSKLTNFSRQDNQDLSETFFSGRVLPNKNFSSFSVKYVLNPLPCGNWSESCLGPQIEDPIEESTGLPRSRVLLITFSCIALWCTKESLAPPPGSVPSF
ncbi:LRR receptor-like serine/threonine-protein kinase RCH1 [Papaver somniferum]|uniref:LRR receptor-like serine/threonine-protein kinase RCH1 n=1 Tax=Papaver somniferum TaxID=3469 RepID=UPI000E6FE6F7|nr:LRR receptor-like serine/threonine-protein kinase RCH1 [Papaver somniferum]